MNEYSAVRSVRVLWGALFVAMALVACGGDKSASMLSSAKEYLAKQDPKAAIIQLKNLLQEAPESPEARALLGQALMRTGDAVGSEAELRKALVLKHPPEQVVPTLAQSLIAQRQYKKLTDEFAATVLNLPDAQASLKSSLAWAYTAQGKAEQADAAVSAALAAVPNFGPALLVQARGKAAQREFDASMALVDKILASTPRDHEALSLQGDIYLYGKGNATEAIASYRKALEAKPDFADGHVRVITTLLRDGKNADAEKQLEVLKKLYPNAFQTRYFDAVAAFQRKDFKRARELAQQLVKLAPDNTMSLQLAGAVELQFNSLVQAETYLSKALQASPESVFVRRLLVSTYLRAGQHAKALTTLQPMLKSDTTDASASALAGEAYLQAGDMAKAEEHFARSAKQDPKNVRSRTALALTHLASGKEQSALGDLEAIAAADDGTTADLALISALLRRKELDKALKAIDALEKKQPNMPLAPNLRGRTLLAKQDTAGARKNFERSVALDAAYFPSVASLAAMDLAEQKPDEARKRFDAVLAKDPKNVQALVAIAELRARAGAPKTELADLLGKAVAASPTDRAPHLLLIDLHLRKKDFKLALTAAQNAVAAIPDSPELLDALGRAQQASGDTNQAMITFNKVAAMQPQSPLPQLRLASAYAAAKNPEAAAASLRKALDIKPDSIDAQRGLLMIAIDAKRYDDAVLIAKTIQKQRPKDQEGYRLEGDIAASQRKWDAAVEAYRNGIKQAPSPNLAAKLHTAYRSAGKSAEMEKFALTWMKDNPKDVAFRLFLADASASLRDYSNAEKMYMSVVQIEPGNHVALNNLAWVAGKLKKDYAIGYAEKAVALAPKQPAYLDTLATLYAEKNDYAKAVETQKKAMELAPQAPIYKLNMAKIHIKGGKKDLARKELDEVVKLGDKFSGQAEAAALLKGL